MKKLFSITLLTFSLLQAGILVKQAKQFHFTKCLNLVKSLENFIVEDNNDYGTWSVAAKIDPNDEFFTATIEINPTNENPILVNLSIFPDNKTKTCSFVYTKTIVFNKNCIAVSKILKNFEYLGTLNKSIVVLKNKNNVKLFLYPIDNNKCLVQKKEIGYRFSKQD